MSSLDPFERAKLSLSPGEVLRVTAEGSAVVEVLEGAALGTTAVTNASQTFGPYAFPARLTVQCLSGRAEYGPEVTSGPLVASGVNGSFSITAPDGGTVALSEPIEEVLADPSATTQILTGPGEYFHYRCTVAAGNITVYDNTASSGKILVPTTALAVGSFPIFGAGISRSLIVENGIRVVLSGAATVYIGRVAY